MPKLGLVFAGGGGKGAYEIGVWKALKEYGVDKSIKAVSGTSVGGLNGALFAKGDFEQGLKVWQEMSPEKILQVNPDKIISALAKFNLPATVLTTISNKLGFMKSEGIFSQKGLKSIIKDSLKEGELKDKIPLYICATDVNNKLSWKPLYKKLNNLNYEDIVQYLLATSAIPIAFPTTIVDDIELLDGFLTDNTPVKPIIEIENCEQVIVVLLGRSETFLDIEKQYPNTSFWKIVPTGDTKESLGSLNFKNETANTLIDMGYNDTIKILQNLYEFMLVEQEFIQKGETLKIQDNGFKKIVTNNSLLRNQYKQLQLDYKNMSSIEYLLSTSKHKKEITLQNYSKELVTTLELQEKQLIDSELNKVFEQMKDNSVEIAKFAFDSVTSLSSTTGRINYQANQGHFSRFISAITRSNHNLQAEINSDFSKSIYANQQMIEKLAQRNNLTLDICISLGNKLNYLANGINTLQEQNIQQFQMMGDLRGAIFTLADVTREAIGKNTQRIEKLEYGQTLLNWSHNLKANLKGLNEYEQIMKVVSDYNQITYNKDEDSSQFLYSALVNCDLDKVKINTASFIEYVVDNSSQSNLPLFEAMDSSNFLPIPKSYETAIPVLSAIEKIYDYNNSFDQVSTYFEDKYDMNFDSELNGVDFAFELLASLKISSSLKQSLANEKAQMIDSLTKISQILKDDKIDIFDKEISRLKVKIENFKVIVPIIGKFSSGKSRLLNTYISKNDKLFKVDTNPTTAVASEIRYAPQNSIEVFYTNKKIDTINLHEQESIDLSKVEYIKYFLNYKKLKYRKDLVLVDMPGFESSDLNHNNAINHYFNKGHHYIIALASESVNDHSILKHIKEILSYGATFSILITKSDKKLPKNIKSLVNILKENISRKYPQAQFFIGITSSNKNELDDFEMIIDDIYKNSPLIFKNKYQKSLEIELDKISKHYERVLKAPNNIAEFEKQLKIEQQNYDEYKHNLERKLKDLRYELVSNTTQDLISKVQSILNANVSLLESAVKGNTLQIKIIDLTRSGLNSILLKAIEKVKKDLQSESIDISHEIDINLNIPQIDTNLSFWGKIKDMLFDSQSKEIREKLNNEVIPNIIASLPNDFKLQLESIYEEINKLIESKLKEHEDKTKKTTDELREQILHQGNEFEKVQKKYMESFKIIKKMRK